ncbi:aminotransferase class III-fold pyridoxal phosphate-dependent enzyme [Pseudoroseomonas wenyumeiae]
MPVRDLFETTTTVSSLARALATRLAAAPVSAASPPPTLAAMPVPAAAPSIPAPPPDTVLDDPRQQQHVAALVARYTARTAASKRLAAEKRAGLADVRAAAGFKLLIKEMLYPIVVERGDGGHVTDVDGNDYVDVTMGFGVRLFGHRAAFLDAALRDQLDRDAPLGPENRDTGDVAALLRRMTGMERVAFFTTGTEAVMTALRLARARSGRDGLVLFKGSYHGHADATLGIGLPDGRAAPLSAGVPSTTLQHLTILDYGSEDALHRIEAQAAHLAAVVVEPVQSRHPDRQPQAFLQALRRITQQHGIALIFDEMITGFRIGAGGAQAWFGVEADIAAYGKIVGGGMPVGVVAGKAAWMDGLDGGAWRFGDATYPEKPAIFYAGTFNKNPWTMAAARAVLAEIDARGPALFTALNRRTTWLATALNAFFAREGVALEVVHFASLFRFRVGGQADLFFFHMIARGIYIWEGRNCFLAAAHDDADVERIMAAARDSALALRADALLDAAPPRHATPSPPRRRNCCCWSGSTPMPRWPTTFT